MYCLLLVVDHPIATMGGDHEDRSLVISFGSWLGYITVGCLKYLWFLICVGCFYELIVYLVNML